MSPNSFVHRNQVLVAQRFVVESVDFAQIDGVDVDPPFVRNERVRDELLPDIRLQNGHIFLGLHFQHNISAAKQKTRQTSRGSTGHRGRRQWHRQEYAGKLNSRIRAFYRKLQNSPFYSPHPRPLFVGRIGGEGDTEKNGCGIQEAVKCRTRFHLFLGEGVAQESRTVEYEESGKSDTLDKRNLSESSPRLSSIA